MGFKMLEKLYTLLLGWGIIVFMFCILDIINFSVIFVIVYSGSWALYQLFLQKTQTNVTKNNIMSDNEFIIYAIYILIVLSCFMIAIPLCITILWNM